MNPDLEDQLASVHGSLKFVDGGIEGGVGAGCPLQSLGDTEPLTVDTVQNTGQRCGHLLRENLREPGRAWYG